MTPGVPRNWVLAFAWRQVAGPGGRHLERPPTQGVLGRWSLTPLTAGWLRSTCHA